MKDFTLILQRQGMLRSPRLVEAFEHVDRARFLPSEMGHLAYVDTALPIGSGQTISQPSTVAFMLELLAPERGDNVLDVGSGSAWQTALLAYVVGEGGYIYAIEHVSSVAHFGKENMAMLPHLESRVDFYVQDAAMGLPDMARSIGGFDCIVAAAELTHVPSAWYKQLKVEGRMVYPKRGLLWLEIHKKPSEWTATEYPGFVFVPFISDVA